METAILDSGASMPENRPLQIPERSILGGQASTQARSTPFELTSSPNAHIRNPSRKKITINVEPAIFLFSLSFGVINSMQTLFLYWARCVEIFKDQPGEDMQNVSKLCADISSNNDTSYSDIVEKDIAYMMIYIQAASTVFTLISAPIIGFVSDKITGRRIPLLVCLFGFTSYCGFQTLSVLYYETINVYYFISGAQILSGMLGGISTVFTLSMAIVTDDCRNEHSMNSNGVPFRIAISAAVQQVGILCGSFIVTLFSSSPHVSVAKHVEGYVNMCLVSLLCSVAALLYCFIWMKDSYKVEKASENRRPLTEDTVEPVRSTSQSENRTWKENVKKFSYELVEVLCQRRAGWTRFCLNLFILFMFTDFLVNDTSLLCLLVKRPPLSWTDAQFSNFIVLRTLAGMVGMMLIPTIFNKLNFIGADSLMIIIGVFACIIINLMQSLGTSTGIIFATTFFTIFGGGLSPAYRTVLSKIIPQDQTARLFSIVSIILVLCPLVSSLIFNNIYEVTLNTWPGFVFFIYAIIHLIVLCGQILIYKLMYPLWEKDHYMNQGFVVTEDQERPLLVDQDDADFDVLENHPDSILTNTSAHSGSSLEYNSTQERPNV